MAAHSYLSVIRSSSRRSSISSCTSEDRRPANFEALRHDVEDIKDMIRRLYRQVDSYDEKRLQLSEGLENLKRANKDYEHRVRDLLEIFKNPPPTINFSYSSKNSNRLGFQSSNRSSRSSSRSGTNAAVFDDDYDDDSSYDDYSHERNFTKSVENIEDESSEA